MDPFENCLPKTASQVTTNDVKRELSFKRHERQARWSFAAEQFRRTENWSNWFFVNEQQITQNWWLLIAAITIGNLWQSLTLLQGEASLDESLAASKMLGLTPRRCPKGEEVFQRELQIQKFRTQNCEKNCKTYVFSEFWGNKEWRSPRFALLLRCARYGRSKLLLVSPYATKEMRICLRARVASVEGSAHWNNPLSLSVPGQCTNLMCHLRMNMLKKNPFDGGKMKRERERSRKRERERFKKSQVFFGQLYRADFLC